MKARTEGKSLSPEVRGGVLQDYDDRDRGKRLAAAQKRQASGIFLGRIIRAAMELNDSALVQIFRDLVRSLEWTAREIEHLRQTVCSDPELLKKYQETTRHPPTYP
jgi:hypothetical protein